MNFKNVSKNAPCLICSKSDWCSRSDDGRVHCCRRVSNGGIKKFDRSGAEYYLHFDDKNEFDQKSYHQQTWRKKWNR